MKITKDQAHMNIHYYPKYLIGYDGSLNHILVRTIKCKTTNNKYSFYSRYSIHV